MESGDNGSRQCPAATAAATAAAALSWLEASAIKHYQSNWITRRHPVHTRNTRPATEQKRPSPPPGIIHSQPTLVYIVSPSILLVMGEPATCVAHSQEVMTTHYYLPSSSDLVDG